MYAPVAGRRLDDGRALELAAAYAFSLIDEDEGRIVAVLKAALAVGDEVLAIAALAALYAKSGCSYAACMKARIACILEGRATPSAILDALL